MAFSLYAATVPQYMQMLRATGRWLDKAEAFAADKGMALQTLLDARLIGDMLPLSFQVKSVATHSRKAMEGAREGLFRPADLSLPQDIGALRALLSDALSALDGFTPEEVDGFVGCEVRFQYKDKVLLFAAEDFLLSFCLPNFFFHASTAYDLLRMQGVPLGKPDFLGRLRLKK